MNRKYNLDYLLHLQKNARLYMVGMTILAFFMAVTLFLYLEPWEPENSTAFWVQNDSDQVIAEQSQQSEEQNSAEEQNIATQNKTQNSNTEAVHPLNSISEETKTQQNKPSEEETSSDTPAEMQTVDLLQIADFAAPCNGSLLYGYGIGYDLLYDDYRFHDAVCYQTGGAEIFAVADGIVKQADAEADWQLILQCGEYQIAYQGVQVCEAAEGEAVTAGQIIGTAGETLRVKAIKRL